MRNGRFDAVFIDFYGTLVTGDRLAVEKSCERVVADHGLEMTPGELAIAWGKRFFLAIESSNGDDFETLFDCECRTLCQTVEPLIGPIDPTPYALMLKAYWASPELADGVLEGLAGIDKPVCIVSNADTEDIEIAVANLNLPIDSVVTSEDARSYKPDAAIFRHALEYMDVDPARVVHVGDSLHSDVGGAAKLGIATCLVRYADRILDVGTGQADHEITDLRELASILGE
jgi:HAD superfamily hydrolase (TIGR01509 family)